MSFSKTLIELRALGIVPGQNSNSSVVDALTGNESNAAPSVRAIKELLATYVSTSQLGSAINTAIGSLNLLPQPTADTSNGTEDTSLSGNVLTNDTTLTGTLSVVSYKIISNSSPGGTTYTAGVTSVSNPVGTFVMRGDGSWNLTPRLNVSGTLPIIRYTVTNGLGESTGTLQIVLTPVNDAPVAGNDSVESAPNSIVNINVAGNDNDPDGDPLTVISINGSAVTVGGPSVSVTNGSVALVSSTSIQVVPTASFEGYITFPYVVTDGTLSTTGNVTVWVHPLSTGGGTSNYKTNLDPIAVFDWSGTYPAKRRSVVEPSTGATLKRLTDVTNDYPGQTALFQGYSRYPAENVTGELVIAFAGNSFNTAIIERGTGNVVAHLTYDNSGLESHGIGTFHEVRWHYGNDHPYRVYYVYNQEFWMIDDVRNQNGSRILIKDFSTVIDWAGVGTDSTRRIMNDQEGNSSLDSDHWAWMATDGYGGTAPVRCYIHYQISTDTVHTFYPADCAGIARAPAGESSRTTFRFRPNTIEPTPDGSGIMIHHSRAVGGFQDAYGVTFFEAPYIFPLDFVAGGPGTFTPFRIANDASHSGWSKLNGEWYFVFQDNNRDMFTAAPISGANRGYGNDGVHDVYTALGPRIVDFYHDVDPYPGWHFGVCTADGWAMSSSYLTQEPSTTYVANGLYMHEIKPIADNPIQWHVTPSANLFPSSEKQDYNEAPASINLAATRITTCGDWDGTAPLISQGSIARYMDMYEVALPTGWQSHFAPAAPVSSIAPAVSGNATQGQTLTATYGTWTGFPTPTVSGIWQRDGVDISGETTLTHLLGSADAGHVLRFKVTAINASAPGGVIVYSNATSTIAALALPVNTVAPVLSGSALEGQQLTLVNGTWSNSPTLIHHDLMRDDIVVASDITLPYMIVTADVGTTLKIRERAENGLGFGTAVTSNAIGPIAENPGSISRVNTVSATGPSGWDFTDLPAMNVSAHNLIVVNVRWDDPGNDNSTSVTITDTAGNTYTPGPRQAIGSYSSRVQQFYCLDAIANSNNVIHIQDSVRASPLDAIAVQYTASSGTTWSLSGSIVTIGTDYVAAPVVTSAFNVPAGSVYVGFISEIYTPVTINTYGDTLVNTASNSWVIEHMSANGITGKTLSASSGNAYSRFGVSVATFRRT